MVTSREWRLFSKAQSKKGGLWYTRVINRTLALYATRLCAAWGLAPDQVSAASIALTWGGLLVLVATRVECVGYGILAWGLLAAGYVLDSADGQLARLQGTSSLRGEWLDHVSDMVKLAAINAVFGLLLLLRESMSGVAMVAFALNAIFQPSHFFAIVLKQKLCSPASVELGRDSTRPLSRLGSVARLVLNLADYGCFVLLVLFLPSMDIFVPLYLGYGVAYMALFFAHFARTYARLGSRPGA